MAILAGTSGIAFIISFFIKEDLRRHHYSQKEKESELSNRRPAEGAYQSDESASSTNSSGEEGLING